MFTLREQRQRTALHIACEKGSVEVVDKLLEMRSDVRHADKVSLSQQLSLNVADLIPLIFERVSIIKIKQFSVYNYKFKMIITM